MVQHEIEVLPDGLVLHIKLRLLESGQVVEADDFDLFDFDDHLQLQRFP